MIVIIIIVGDLRTLLKSSEKRVEETNNTNQITTLSSSARILRDLPSLGLKLTRSVIIIILIIIIMHHVINEKWQTTHNGKS